jgi:peptide deformylase
VPSVYDFVERYARVAVTALDEHGESFSLEADGLLAVCLQHEQDHLDGKLFVDYLSSLKRQRIKAKLLKQQKQNA